ncbi:HEAT repeat domain-containing protein [uncultured Draconibacterium sp.]|uniref:HEAT repeat domain-containing protein n=1 Tax=uncultured Draconibacterium sp. TaxID=1573823 RepID=UPI0032167429
MTQNKINQDTKNKLFSADKNSVLAAINTLKEKGNKEYLPLLFELLLTQSELEVRSEILKLLGTIKDADTIPMYMDALKEERLLAIRKEILTCCWQNGLDFSNYFDDFVDLIIDGEWEIAFEAFTVIENLEHFPPEEKMKESKLRIAGALKLANEQKSYFLEELLKMAP